MYEVDLSPAVETFYAKADRPLARKLARAFEMLEQTPRQHPNITQLVRSSSNLPPLHRYRVGDWRILYRMDESRQMVMVLTIGHRRDIYD